MFTVTLITAWCVGSVDAMLRCALRALPAHLQSNDIHVSLRAGAASFTWTALSSNSMGDLLHKWTTSCTIVAEMTGILLGDGKTWKDIMLQDHSSYECTHIADSHATSISLLSEPTMLFLDSITVPRSGIPVEKFCHSWTALETTGALSRVGHTFVEYLACPTSSPRALKPGKMYLDRDVYVGSEPPNHDTIHFETENVRSKVVEIVAKLSTQDNDLSYCVATRHGFCSGHGQYKLSFRPFIQGMRIRYTDIPTVITNLGQQDFWDMSVYKAREQLLATINGCKGRIAGVMDTRLLLPEEGYADPLLYIAQHVDPEWPFLDIPLTLAAASISKEPDSTLVGPGDSDKEQAPLDTEFVRGLVACLKGSTADDRRKWIAIGVVLKSAGCGGRKYYDDWLRFSMKSCKFIDEQDCAKTWDGLQAGKPLGAVGTCGVGTLCYYARQDDRERYRSLQPNQTTQPQQTQGMQPSTKGKGKGKGKVKRPSASVIPSSNAAAAALRINRARKNMS